MISSLKSPGVYINEINAFPASIAQVATAIPAFIGFTETSPQPNKPTKVRSLLDYQQVFGGAPEPETIDIDLDTERYDVTESKFKLYNSLRLFFANGGGECYIVSIGKYENNMQNVDSGTFTAGIDLIQKVDEVTLIAFPDAIDLGATELGQVHQHALRQCADLMDRFTIMDVIQQDGGKLESNCANFRDATGNQHLKYGAAYYPYLQTNLSYRFRFKDLAGGGVPFTSIYASDDKLKPSIDTFDVLNNEVEEILNQWEQKDTEKLERVDDEATVKVYYNRIWNLLSAVGNIKDLDHTGLKKILSTSIPITLQPYAQKLVDFKNAYENLKKEGTADDVDKLDDLDEENKFNGPWGNINEYETSDDNPFDNGVLSKSIEEATDANDNNIPAHKAPDFNKIKAHLDRLLDQVKISMSALMTSLKEYELVEENNLTAQIPIYPKIIAGLSKAMNTVPPSGAIAGIYAQVDGTRGVWKAPANISVNGIIGLTDDITEREQGDMNLHETGKSINAIRKFTGRGLLVWGARTLDGNSNDWRYVNVRRLAIMIEESVKKACMNFVFEPNVKQTWVNVKGMIENYLTTIWSDGALAGAKPEDAFFVSVGLNNTMTANDINNGRMIVKIGYAPSRPAEFIILQFTQQQQKS